VTITPTSVSKALTKVNSLGLNPGLVIALHSPNALLETGPRMCPPEKSRDSDRLRCRAVRSLQIYRLPWHDGKLTGPAQAALKLPFAFRQGYSGNAYEFSKDLSTVVYARPAGHADLYLLSQK
jgi:hypothetical protein